MPRCVGTRERKGEREGGGGDIFNGIDSIQSMALCGSEVISENLEHRRSILEYLPSDF